MSTTLKTFIWIVVIAAVIFGVWWYVNTYRAPAPAGETSVFEGGDTTADIEEDLSASLQGDLDADFRDLDRDINSF